MSHFTGTVAVSAADIAEATVNGVHELTADMISSLIDERMEKFNETREVEEYEDEVYTAPVGDLPKHKTGPMKWEYDYLLKDGKITVDIDWADFIDAVNTEEDERYLWHSDTRTIGRVTTSNPDGHWDWWTIGGRWKDYLFLRDGNKADFARVKDLSIPRAMNKGGLQAAKSWIACNEYFDRLGRPKSWKHFVDLRNEGVLDDNQMRKQYHGQPAVEALRNDEVISAWSGADEITAALEDFGTAIDKARAQGVATYCYITLDDQWMAPGQMGWFGMSSESEDEQDEYNRGYVTWLESLDPDDVVVVVDMHV